MKKIIVLILLIFFVQSTRFYSQVVYQPIEDDVYSFLDRMSIKQIIDFHKEVLPISRKEIAKYLKEINLKKDLLTKIDIQNLQWFEKEYSSELKDSTISERWFPFSYSDSLLNFKVSPLGGYQMRNFANGKNHKKWWGIRSFATIGENFGMSIDFRDVGEFGENLDVKKIFSPQRAYAYGNSAPGGFEYSDVRGAINLSWNWGSISLRKDYNLWGNGYFGKLIISDKPHSYPHIRLDIKPVNWLRFHYMHAWLSSGVVDSSRFYVSRPSADSLVRYDCVKKYLVINMLTFSPWNFLDVSLGNSMVYAGGEPRIGAFIPFMFYKYLDRDLNKGDVSDGNGSLFFDLLLRYPRNFSFYFTFYLDVMEIRKLLAGNDDNTWFAFSVGTKNTDVFVDNLDFTLEYTRINPWVYEHKDEVTTYKHLYFYPLGHWMGQNSDMLRFQFDYRFIRPLKIKFWYERIRKGGTDKTYTDYHREKINYPFLYSPVRTENNFGLSLKYTPYYDVNIIFDYSYKNITDEDISRYPKFYLGKNDYFTLGVQYGL